MKNISVVSILTIALFTSCFISYGSSGTKVRSEKDESALLFDIEKYELQELSIGDESFTIRAYENILYVAHPVDTTCQIINIYIPVEYFDKKEIAGYTSGTAPIFLKNSIGGYMPSTPQKALGDDRPRRTGGGPSGMKRENVVSRALSEGCVVACPGTRGRTSTSQAGEYTGKAPAHIVDLKAAVRYLKYNDDIMPGNANLIVSDGTSAGGALSALLGASGNAEEYEAYLEEIGAANASDDIFAVMAYCPITILEQADAAYEWQYDGVYTFSGRGGQGTLSTSQIKISKDLAQLFPDYVNSLELESSEGSVLELDETGYGSFKEHVKSFVVSSAQAALNKGMDLSEHKWISIEGKEVIDIDFDAYISYLGRMKTPPAFDALDLSTPENQLFGTTTIDKQHFTAYAAANSTASANRVSDIAVALMNPMTFIGKSNSDISKCWRIRHGAKDPHTALAISAILASKLVNQGYVVDYELPWDVPHSGDYDLDELFAWIRAITQ